VSDDSDKYRRADALIRYADKWAVKYKRIAEILETTETFVSRRARYIGIRRNKVSRPRGGRWQ